jgi:hypothetical protein
MSSIFGNIPDTNVYVKKRFLNPENEYLGTIVNPTVVSGDESVTAQELGFLSGTSTFIQDQLDSKLEATDDIDFSGDVTFEGTVSFDNISTPPHCAAPPINQDDLCNKAYVDSQAPLTSFQVFCNYSQPLYGTYKTLSAAEVYTPTTVSFSASNASPILIGVFANYKSTLQIGSTIPPGNWTLNSYSNVNSINDQAHVGIYFELFGAVSTDPNTETVIATSSQSPLISVVAPSLGTYSNVLTLPSVDISAYTIVGIKIYVIGNVNTSHSGTVHFQEGVSYTSLLTSYASLQASDLLITNNVWSGSNTFNASVSLNNNANLNGEVILNRTAPVLYSTSTTNDLNITAGVGRQIRFLSPFTFTGGNDCVLNSVNTGASNRFITSVSAGSSSYNQQVQSGDNILILGNNGTAGIPATGFLGLWASGTRTGLRMTTTDVNLEGGAGNMTLRMNNTTALTINSSAVATFANTIQGSISGNAATVTNGVITTGSYADPAWITSIAGSKVSGNITGNAETASKIFVARGSEAIAYYVPFFPTNTIGNKNLYFANQSVGINNLLYQEFSGQGNLSCFNFTGNLIGNASTVTDGVYTYESYSNPSWITSLDGSKITGNISGNAGTVTNGVYTTGIYADPTWITSLAGSKITGNISGNAGTVTNGVYTTGSYSNPSWITSLTASKLTGRIDLASAYTIFSDNILSFTNDSGVNLFASGTNGTITFKNNTVVGETTMTIANDGVANFVFNPTCPTATSTDNSTKVATTAFVKAQQGGISQNINTALFGYKALTCDISEISATSTGFANTLATVCAVYIKAGTVVNRYTFWPLTTNNLVPFRLALFGPGTGAPYVVGSDTGGWNTLQAAAVQAPVNYNISPITITTEGVYYIYAHSNLALANNRYVTSTAQNISLFNNIASAATTGSLSTGLFYRSAQVTVAANQAPSVFNLSTATATYLGYVIYLAIS